MIELGIAMLGAGVVGCALFVIIPYVYKKTYKDKQSHKSADKIRKQGLTLYATAIAIGLTLILISCAL